MVAADHHFFEGGTFFARVVVDCSPVDRTAVAVRVGEETLGDGDRFATEFGGRRLYERTTVPSLRLYDRTCTVLPAVDFDDVVRVVRLRVERRVEDAAFVDAATNIIIRSAISARNATRGFVIVPPMPG